MADQVDDVNSAEKTNDDRSACLSMILFQSVEKRHPNVRKNYRLIERQRKQCETHMQALRPFERTSCSNLGSNASKAGRGR